MRDHREPGPLVQLTDADGTTHRFTGHTDGSSVWWREPPGTNLYLRCISGVPGRALGLTRPDGVEFFFDEDGFPTGVREPNGNELAFTLEPTPPGDDPGFMPKRITQVSNGAGTPGTNTKTFLIDYYDKAETSKPQVRGRIQAITDHSGSRLEFRYYDDGNLLRLTQKGGPVDGGTQVLADRAFTFTYMTSSGSGPAIPAAANRAEPDPKTAPQSGQIYSVRDPRGNETLFDYYGPSEEETNRGKLQSRTDRSGATTSFAHDPPAFRTSVQGPLGRTRSYVYDPQGKVTQLTDPKGQATGVSWDETTRTVRTILEPSGRTLQFASNDNGSPTMQQDQLGNRTTLDYEHFAVDANDAPGKWRAGRTTPHMSFVAAKTEPKGSATDAEGDHTWAFDYDDNHNLTLVTDPLGAETSYAYTPAGLLSEIAAPHFGPAYSNTSEVSVTALQQHDANGLPTVVKERIGLGWRTTELGYDADGNLRSVLDPLHAGQPKGVNTRTELAYDPFHRMWRQSTPKWTAGMPGEIVWSFVAYDRNDNVIEEAEPFTARGFNASAGDRIGAQFDAMDRQVRLTSPDVSGDGVGEPTVFAYDAAGRLTSTVRPKGVATAEANDFATRLDYDPLDRVVRERRFDAAGASPRITHACYDDPAGDLKWSTAPRAGLTEVDCAGAMPGFTTEYRFDEAHGLVEVFDPLRHQRSFRYDANRNVTRVIDEQRSEEVRAYDARDRLVEVSRAFLPEAEGIRRLTERYGYDAVGNVAWVASPRAFDASGGDPEENDSYVTRYRYDALNRLVSVPLPKDPLLAQHYLHYGYDANDNLTLTTLPTAQTSASSVPAENRTRLTYFDTGWIRTQNDGIKHAGFDYTGEGLQTSRVALDPSGRPLPAKAFPLGVQYWPGNLVRRVDERDGLFHTYSWDANANPTVTRRGASSGLSKELIASSNGFDELVRVDQKRADEAWKASTFSYDANGNITTRNENRPLAGPGAVPGAGREHTFGYDAADWVQTQVDDHGTASTSDDLRVVNSFWPTGWERERSLYKGSDTSGTNLKQRTTWDWFASGDLRTLRTFTGPEGSLQEIESHTLGYFQDGAFANGNRTQDVFTLKNASNAFCVAAPCTATYRYDAQDRLVAHDDGHGGITSYALDPAGNVLQETKGATVRSFEYAGSRLTRTSGAGGASRYWHDLLGNLDCITTDAGSAADCNVFNPPTPQDSGGSVGGSYEEPLLAEYDFDSLDRLSAFRRASGGELQSSSFYSYDGLGRLVKTSTSANANWRFSNLSYLGVSNFVTSEHENGVNAHDRAYSYDAWGNRLQLTDDPAGSAPPTTYSYGYDVHGSVSMLLRGNGSVAASYGYTPYGQPDQSLSNGDTDPASPINPYRWQAKRFDEASGSYDMGAWRFGPDIGRFLTPDYYLGALSDVGLSADPLTANRYGFAAGNPIGYLEADGHEQLRDGRGASAPAPGTHAADREQTATLRELAAKQFPGETMTEYANRVQATIPQAPAPDLSMQDVLSAGVEVGLFFLPVGRLASWVVKGARWVAAAGKGARSGGKLSHAANAGSEAANAANAARLARQLEFQEAASIFDKAGDLKPEIVAGAFKILPSAKLRDSAVIKALSSEGGNFLDWAKYATREFRSPSGYFQAHFYYNQVTKRMSRFQYKIKFTRFTHQGGPL